MLADQYQGLPLGGMGATPEALRFAPLLDGFFVAGRFSAT